ncbi:MAG: hypothetical protein IKD79_02035 [Oscillospiraceae bacterium]|nr:hypothetical protein [Oscillospiraceae bacterium]
MKTRRLIALFVALLIIIGLEIALLSRCSRAATQAKLPEMTPIPTDPPISQEFIAPGTQTVPPDATQPPEPTPTASPGMSPMVTTPSPSPIPTPTPTPLPTPTPTASPTPTPTAGPTPTPADAPTDTPAPTDAPPDGGTRQGSFSSSTGTSLNMNVAWSAADNGDGTTLITVSGTVTSYSLDLALLYEAAYINLADYGVTCNTNRVYVSPEEGNVTNPLFSTSFTVPTGTQGTMTVSWRFGGTYAGVQMYTIEASGYVSTG